MRNISCPIDFSLQSCHISNRIFFYEKKALTHPSSHLKEDIFAEKNFFLFLLNPYDDTEEKPHNALMHEILFPNMYLVCCK